VAENRHVFNSFVIAAAKALSQVVERGPAAGLVSVIASNGAQLGIRIGGVDRWFLAPAPTGRACLFEGFTTEDAHPVVGDSFVAETVGLGCAALTAAPAAGSYFGLSASQANDVVDRMRGISAVASQRFLVPYENFRGTPVGLDVDRIVAQHTTPTVNNSLIHRRPGIGQIGAGITELPIGPFAEASALLATTGTTASGAVAQGRLQSDRIVSRDYLAS
jgi:hypothetical protein